MTRSYATRAEPNDWVLYVDADTGEIIHVALYHNSERRLRRPGAPPGGWQRLPTDEVF